VVPDGELRYHEACTVGIQSTARHSLHPQRVNPDAIAKFERLLAAGRDGVARYFGLARGYF
jgi:hypothetical protein